MQSFIDLFIQELLKNNTDLTGHCVVFPTRRAGLIFKKKFSEHISKPAWLPAVYSIDDFISFLSPYQVADATHLVMELYTAYRKFFPETPFEKFIPWGEMLLKDFNEVDLQMVHAEKLFSQVISLKEIDMLVGVDEEETERIKNFWKLFSDQEISKLKGAFLENWSSLPVLYKEFKQQLHARNLAYSGMAARTIAESIENGNIPITWNKIHFAGFYALSNSEKRIFNDLIALGKAEVIWDADHYYTGDKRQEAGKYFRKKQLNQQPEEWKWTFDYFKNEQRAIHIIGIPLVVGQAKYAGLLLQKNPEDFTSYDHTVIVIPDEKLLLPVLYALPSQVASLNVTMGYPLQGTNIELLLWSLKNIWERKDKIDSGTYFISADVIALLENKYVWLLQATESNKWIRQLKKENRYILSAAFFEEKDCHPIIKTILNSNRPDTDVITYLEEVFHALLIYYHEHAGKIHLLDFGLLKFFHEEVQNLSRLIRGYKTVIDFSDAAAWKLIIELLRSLRVPFTGEPVKGLQVMGFLETRNLDFENLFILSLNEEVMPGNSQGNSYIPFAVRKAYGLPTYEDQDAIYAYHFYRLLQRAKNTYLFYNTETGGSSGSEMSRYILQIAYEMKSRLGERLQLTHQLVGTDLHAIDIDVISIKKQGPLLEELQSMFYSKDEKRKKWSATSFSSYINCSLQFYFRYLAGIKEPDEIKEEIDSAVFGSIVHLVMQQFYESEKMITADYIHSLLPLVDQAVEIAIRSEFPAKPGKLTGKNSLLKTVMTDLIKKILMRDKTETPFLITGLENTFNHELSVNGNSISLLGKIDRIDELNGVTRIIDYKTGKDKIPDKLIMENLFYDPNQKASFQLLMYAMLYKRSNENKKVKAGIYRLRSISQGIDFLMDGAEITTEQIDDFEERLGNLISEILNPEFEFNQTTDLKRCLYCPYKEICSR